MAEQSRICNLANDPIPVAYADGPGLDGFGRLRVSNPETLFDSKNIFDDPDLADNVENQPLFYDNQQTSGSGTTTAYNPNESTQTISVAGTTAGVRIRQTRQRFNYQPGKSQLVFMTFRLGDIESGIGKGEGIFDDNNGIFLESDGIVTSTRYFVRRTSTSGSPVDNKVAQANWNVDPMNGSGPSRITLDFAKTQILVIDYEWLGVGRVRCGFVVDGCLYYAHEFRNTNVLDKVYMRTPNLPLRSYIANDGSGVASSLTQICSTVISEGGSQDLGIVRFVSTAGAHVDLALENTEYAVLGIRLKANYLGATIKLIQAALQIHTASHKVLWRLRFNPTVAGAFTYTNVAQSAIQLAVGATANTVSSGYVLAGGFLESGGIPSGAAGSAEGALNNALRLGSLIAGTPDTIVLTAMPIAGSTAVDVEGGLTFRELV